MKSVYEVVVDFRHPPSLRGLDTTVTYLVECGGTGRASRLAIRCAKKDAQKGGYAPKVLRVNQIGEIDARA